MVEEKDIQEDAWEEDHKAIDPVRDREVFREEGDGLIKAAWAASAELRDEFLDDFEAYSAYKRGVAAGTVKIFSRPAASGGPVSLDEFGGDVAARDSFLKAAAEGRVRILAPAAGATPASREDLGEDESTAGAPEHLMSVEQVRAYATRGMVMITGGEIRLSPLVIVERSPAAE